MVFREVRKYRSHIIDCSTHLWQVQTGRKRLKSRFGAGFVLCGRAEAGLAPVTEGSWPGASRTPHHRQYPPVLCRGGGGVCVRERMVVMAISNRQDLPLCFPHPLSLRPPHRQGQACLSINKLQPLFGSLCWRQISNQESDGDWDIKWGL